MGAQVPGVTLLKHRTVTTLRMIVCIPGARSVSKEPGAWISAVRSMYTICETALRWVRCWGLHTSHSILHTSHPTPHTSHLTPHTSHLTPHTSHPTPPHSLYRTSYHRQQTSSVGPSLTIPHASHLERLTLPTSSVTLTASHYPLRASARRNKRLLWQICRFLRYPKLGAMGIDGFGAPVNDNHYRYRLQTGTSMIIVVIYIYKPKWEWLSIVLVNENDYHYPMANDN